MEITLNSFALAWIDKNRQQMSRQAFIRELLYNTINATSGEETNDKARQRTNPDGNSGLCNKD